MTSTVLFTALRFSPSPSSTEHNFIATLKHARPKSQASTSKLSLSSYFFPFLCITHVIVILSSLRLLQAMTAPEPDPVDPKSHPYSAFDIRQALKALVKKREKGTPCLPTVCMQLPWSPRASGPSSPQLDPEAYQMSSHSVSSTNSLDLYTKELDWYHRAEETTAEPEPTVGQNLNSTKPNVKSPELELSNKPSSTKNSQSAKKTTHVEQAMTMQEMPTTSEEHTLLHLKR
jgi:hypothetical protein